MKKLDWIILLCIIPIGEVHKLFYGVNKVVDPFLLISYPLDFQWIVKDNTIMLQFCMVAFLLYRAAKYIRGGSEFRIAAKALLFLSFLDICWYWLNFKTGWYGGVYFLIAISIVLIKIKSLK